MGNSVKNYTTKDWVRLAAKLSLLFTEPKVRRAVGERIKDGVDDITETVTGKYEDVSDAVASNHEAPAPADHPLIPLRNGDGAGSRPFCLAKSVTYSRAAARSMRVRT